jgi:hypothetical protein
MFDSLHVYIRSFCGALFRHWIVDFVSIYVYSRNAVCYPTLDLKVELILLFTFYLCSLY